MQFLLLPGVHTSMTHNDIEDALCIIREKSTTPFCADISQLLHIFLYLISDVPPLEPNQLYGISATCQNLLRWLTFHETPYLAS